MNTAVSKPSRSTARNAIPTSASAEPLASALATPDSSSRFSPRALRRIHDHVGDRDDGDQAHHGLEALLLALGEIVVRDPQRHGYAQAERDREAHADPHSSERVPAAFLDQERRHDADD